MLAKVSPQRFSCLQTTDERIEAALSCSTAREEECVDIGHVLERINDDGGKDAETNQVHI